MSDVHQQVDEIVKGNDVVVFMKGTAAMPMCGFTATVIQILNQLNIPFKDVNVLIDPALRQGVKDYTNWPTIPQLYIKGEFIGGCDIVREMFQNGELQSLFKQKQLLSDA
jgi:monothiol glutaredoxin